MTAVWVLLTVALIATGFTKAGWLTVSGAGAATLVASATFMGAGWIGILALGLFFVSGTVLTKNTERLGRHPDGVKGSRRDAKQVFANGGVLACGALMIPTFPLIGWSVFAGALGTAQADTWATEVGALGKGDPRMVTSGKRVPRGTSGAVSSVGTFGGLAGATSAAVFLAALSAPTLMPWAALAGGFAGMLVDSVLGATIEGAYFCETCEESSPSAMHTCNNPAPLARGLPACTNDTVNFLSTTCGAAISTGLVLGLTA